MAFFAALARFIAVDKLRSFGEETLAHGREVFARELQSGKSKDEAAKAALRSMRVHAASRGKERLQGAEQMVRTVSTQARRAGQEVLRKGFGLLKK